MVLHGPSIRLPGRESHARFQLAESLRHRSGEGGGADFASNGSVVGADVIDTSGGQPAILFGLLNPNINISNQILLLSFDLATLPLVAG